MISLKNFLCSKKALKNSYNNRLLTETSAAGPTEKKVNYSYDNNGSLIFKGTELYTDADGTEQEEMSLSVSGSGTAGSNIADAMAIHYSYNDRGQLTNVQTDNGINASYAYDVSGRRSAKTVNGTTTNQIWDGQNIVRETNGSGAEIAKYYRGSRLVAQKSGTAVSYYTYDAHGSVAAMNGQGYEYDAYGNLLENGVTSRNPFRYNGEYYDEETGMIYLRARYYDSSIGRFITEDPAKDGLNWYAFCSNDPVTFVDSSGFEIEVAQKDYDEYKLMVQTAYGKNVKINATEGKNSYTISGFEFFGIPNSCTAAALLNYQAKDTAVYRVTFFAGMNSEKGNAAKGSSGINARMDFANILINTMNTATGEKVNSAEILARYSHESTHLYTKRKGYEDKVTNAIKTNDTNVREIVKKGYLEAVAVTTENQVRAELDRSGLKVGSRDLSDGYVTGLDVSAKMPNDAEGYGFGFWHGYRANSREVVSVKDNISRPVYYMENMNMMEQMSPET